MTVTPFSELTICFRRQPPLAVAVDGLSTLQEQFEELEAGNDG